MKYTAAQFRRGARRLQKNAKLVVDNMGVVYLITKSKRILQVKNPMTGDWEQPSRTDGVRRGAMRHIYLEAPHIPWLDV